MIRAAAVLAIASMALVATPAAANCPPQFHSPANYELGGGPIDTSAPVLGSIALANLNGDEWLDLVIGTTEFGRRSRGLLWMMGGPNATFGPVRVTHADTAFGSIAVADFDRDRDDDVIAFSYSRPLELVLFRNDGGHLVRAAAFPRAAASDVETGDFNGDARPDFAVVETNGANVTLMLGRGDGTFEERTFAVDGARFGSRVVAADFDRDGHDDLAVPHTTDGSVLVLLSAPTGGFRPTVVHQLGRGAADLQVAHVDGDGYPDLLVQFFMPALAVIRNVRSAPAFGHLTYSLSAEPETVAAGRFGRGALPAVAATERGALRIYSAQTIVELGRFMLFGPPTFPARDLAVADLDGDGDDDIVAAGATNITVLRSNGDGSFDAPSSLMEANAIADFTGDGRPDVLSGLAAAVGRGDGTFIGGPRGVNRMNAYTPAIADLDGDGLLDYVYNERSPSGELRVGLSRGDGSFDVREQRVPGGFAAGDPQLADVNGDARPDLIVLVAPNRTVQRIAILHGNGDGTFGYASELDGSFDGVRTGDFNRDGRPDLLATRSFGQATVMLGDGFGGFTPGPNVGPLRSASTTVADVDGDRYDDIVSVTSFTRLTLLRSRGDGTFQPNDIPFASLPWGNSQKPIVADLDADGFRDILIVEDPLDELRLGFAQMLLADGRGGFRPAMVMRTSGTGTVVVGDLNGDRRPDLVDAGFVRLSTQCPARRRSTN